MELLKAYKRYKRAYKNYISVMLNLYRRKNVINVILSNGMRQSLSSRTVYRLSVLVNQKIDISKIPLNKLEKLTDFENFNVMIEKGVDFQKAMEIIENEKIPYKNSVITIHGLKNNGDVLGVFIQEEYKFLNVKDKIVIDIGANIGDSAIYFTLNGAKKVIALEPYLYSFNFAVRNIQENNFENKIEILHAGFGQDGEVSVANDLVSNGHRDLKPSEKGEKIKIYSLQSLIDKFGIDADTAVLKMDCEGCEYNLLNEKDTALAKFSQIQIEYHYGYKNLVKKLQDSGFECRYTKPTKSFESDKTNPNVLLGYIYASKH